jgi:hypothetical protein
LSVGLNNDHAKEFYSYLCGYAHAGNPSVIQVRQAITAEYQRDLCGAIMGILMIAIAYMIKGYCKLFDKSLTVLNKNSETLKTVDFWVEIGATSLDDGKIDWEKAGF